MGDPEQWNGHHERDGGGADEGGYAIEIASVRALISPLEESVVAARAIAGEQEKLTGYLAKAGVADIQLGGEGFVSAWGYGMGELAKHAETVAEHLYEAIAAYMLADLLQVERFWPSDANIAKLPAGPSTQWVAKHYGVPDMEERPEPLDWSRIREFEDES